jgi:hypothetical protein
MFFVVEFLFSSESISLLPSPALLFQGIPVFLARDRSFLRLLVKLHNVETFLVIFWFSLVDGRVRKGQTLHQY